MQYIDTDVFLYWATDHPKHGQRATEILRNVELNEKAVTSAFALFLFDKVMEGTEGYSLRNFLDQVGKIRNLKVVPLEADHLREAGQARKKFRVPMEVAVAYAVAQSRGIQAVYSANTEFDKTDLRRQF